MIKHYGVFRILNITYRMMIQRVQRYSVPCADLVGRDIIIIAGAREAYLCDVRSSVIGARDVCNIMFTIACHPNRSLWPTHTQIHSHQHTYTYRDIQT